MIFLNNTYGWFYKFNKLTTNQFIAKLYHLLNAYHSRMGLLLTSIYCYCIFKPQFRLIPTSIFFLNYHMIIRLLQVASMWTHCTRVVDQFCYFHYWKKPKKKQLAPFSISIPSKRAGSWKSMPTLRRRVSTSRSRISRPSKNTVPKGGSHNLFSALNIVDFPLPLGPMIPTITPFGISALIPFSRGTPASDSFVRLTIRNFVSATSGLVSSTSTTSRCSSTLASPTQVN